MTDDEKASQSSTDHEQIAEVEPQPVLGSGNYFKVQGKVTNQERNFDSFGVPDWELPFEENKNRNLEEK